MNQQGEWGHWRLVSTSCWWKWPRDLSEGRLPLRFKFALLLCAVPPHPAQTSVKRAIHSVCLLLLDCGDRVLLAGGLEDPCREPWGCGGGRDPGDLEQWEAWRCWEDVDGPPQGHGVQTNFYISLC